MTLEPTKKPEDMFYEVFVKRNEIALYDDSKVVDLDVLAIPFRGGYSGSRRNKRGAKFAAKTTPNITTKHNALQFEVVSSYVRGDRRVRRPFVVS